MIKTLKKLILLISTGFLISTGISCQKSQPASDQKPPSQETQAESGDAVTVTDNPQDGVKPETNPDNSQDKVVDSEHAGDLPVAENSEHNTESAAPVPEPPALDPDFPFQNPEAAIHESEARMEAEDFDGALQILLEAEYHFGHSKDLSEAYWKAYRAHPKLNAEPRLLEAGQDVTGIKRIGGGSSLVYKLYKDKETIAAFKPFQKRFQSNHRAEIAAYRLCPLIKCGYDIPVNLPVYFDYHAFSGLYARNSANPKDEFNEIIPTKLPGDIHRVEGTFKDWIPDYADYPIEFKTIWSPWLNPGTTRDDLNTPMSDVIPVIAKKHKGGDKFAQKLAPHLENTSKYELARQISNMLVFDYLINNWDRFSGSPTLYGVNCQIVKGRFMSIDNGAGFPKTPNSKPDKHLHEISRFSRSTYLAIVDLENHQDDVNHILFPNPSDVEKDRLATFWNQRKKYLDYVNQCIKKNGESETFFFE